MTKTKHFHGDFECKAYCKPVGHGYEVGIIMKGRPCFVGNFVHKTEAMKWWGKMTKEIKHFSTHYDFSPSTPHAWYGQFLGHHVYTCYYKYLGTVMPSNTRYYQSALKNDVKKYKRSYKTA